MCINNISKNSPNIFGKTKREFCAIIVLSQNEGVTEMKKRVFLFTLLACVILISASALAISIADTRQLNATFNNIKIHVDGQLIAPKDALGRPVEPFIVDGSTYLPVRAVAEALGKDVEWDGPNQSVYIGVKPNIAPPVTSVIPPTSPKSFPGKIAIITNADIQNPEEYYSAAEVVKKYGADKIIHKTWPIKFPEEGEQMIRLVQQIAADPEVKALIINQAVLNSMAAVDKLLETRGDIFTVAIYPTENPPDLARRYNLILSTDEVAMGFAMPAQAKKMGAKTFMHLSFPRHMSYEMIAARYKILQEECAKLGLDFVTYTVPDPISDIGMYGAQQVMLEEVPKLVAHYGKDTAFFCTNCGLQAQLIKGVVDNGGIYVQPCCPSPFHGFPAALGLTNEGQSVFDKYGTKDTADIVVANITEKLRAKNMLGRVSTWPVPVAMMGTAAATEYAIKWINGEVPKNGIDHAILKKCLADYAGVPVDTRTLGTYESDLDMSDEPLPNWVLVREDYLTFK
jgi:hypothetical protein